MHSKKRLSMLIFDSRKVKKIKYECDVKTLKERLEEESKRWE